MRITVFEGIKIMGNTKDEHIDLLLTYMKEDVESKGMTPQVCRFDLNHDGEDFLAFKAKSRLTEEDIDKVLKICHSRGYIKSEGSRRGVARLLVVIASDATQSQPFRNRLLLEQ